MATYLAKVYAGFSIDMSSPEHRASELLAEWISVVKVLEEGRAA
jgi:hypothetical protein